MSTQKFSTNALHAGHDVTQTAGTRAVPIYQTTSYVFNNTDHAANLFSLKELGFIYTRLNNPTNQILQERLATLEGGTGAVVFASGSAAIATGLLTLLKSGDHIVASSSLYGGTFNLLNVTLPRLGITTTFVDASDPDSFAEAVQENTRAFFVESLGNPKLDVLDLEAISEHAKVARVPFIVDNTVATPALLNPIKHGANIVIHSLTKYIGGHGTSLGGAIIDAGTFDWSSGKFPEFTEPSAGYHGLVYHDVLGAASFTFKLILEGLRDFGGALSPNNVLHHGKKLQERFQLSAYKMMNHLLRTIEVTNASNWAFELNKIKAQIHLVAIDSDLFFLAQENKETYKKLAESNCNVFYHEIVSIHGHDAFLIEFDQLDKILRPLFKS